MTRPLNVGGERYGRLVARERVGRSPAGQAIWSFRCDCGNTTEKRLGDVRSGRIESCGCLLRAVRHVAHRTHGHSSEKRETAEYRAWKAMIGRCHNDRTPCFHRYGGRGIQVCDEWRTNFQAFFDHIGPKPSPLHSVDRYPDRDGNYRPGNVRWATAGEQARNMRSNRMVNLDGEELILGDAAERLGVKREKLAYWLNSGRTIKEMLSRKEVA